MIGSDTQLDIGSVINVLAAMETPISTAQIARYSMPGECDEVVTIKRRFHFDMSLTPRPSGARAAFHRLQTDRFTPLGQVFVLPPGEAVLVRSGSGTTDCVVCELRVDALSQWLGEDAGWSDAMLATFLDMPGTRSRSLLGRIAEELRYPGLGSDVLVELLSAELAIEFARCCAGTVQDERSPGLLPWRLRLIEERLSDGDGIPTISQLAALCGLSTRHLARGYRASRGHTIGEAIARERLRRAQSLLSAGKTVKVIAHELGFSSVSGFSYAFRKASGCTPREFRGRAITRAN